MRTQQIVFLRRLTSVVLFVCLASGAFAKPPRWAPAFGYHKKHHYVYYPKQNFYYDPFLGTYIVLERGVWVRQVRPPRLFASININVLPHVDLYIASYHPYYYNDDHCDRYYLVSALAPPSEFYVYRHPRRYDFSITPYHYRPRPNVSVAITFYNPNYYLHPEYGNHPHYHGKHHGKHHGNGHAYGHYKHNKGHHDGWYGDDHYKGHPKHGGWDGDKGHGKNHGKSHYKHEKQHAPVNRPPDKWESPNSHSKGKKHVNQEIYRNEPNHGPGKHQGPEKQQNIGKQGPDKQYDPGKQQGPGKQPKKVDHQQSQPHPVMVARDNNHGKQGGPVTGGGGGHQSGKGGGGKGKHGKN